MPHQNEECATEDIGELIKVRREKLKNLIDNGNNPYEITSFKRTHLSQSILNNLEELNGKTVCVCGRIMSRRIMGKASFLHILDGDGQIQLYVKVDALGDAAYEEFKKYDIGDIVGAEGTVFVTHKGETSIAVTSLKLLSKSLLPLPEKWHGLKDNDLRYRQRYVDLIVNRDVKKTFEARGKIISAIRRYLDGRDFIEVETPILNTLAGGAAARPFVTHHNTLNLEMFMRIAPELYLKRLIVGGFERVYELGRMFRNEGMDVRHNPEFTMLELYEAYSDLDAMMDTAEEILDSVRLALSLPKTIVYQQTEISLNRPFKRLSMNEAVKKYTGVDFEQLTDSQALKAAKELGAEIQKGKDSRGYLLFEVFDRHVEKKLIQPTFITDYPLEISPLAKRKAGTGYTHRFELFINGSEIGNAFAELNDPIDQRQRFEAQTRLSELGDDEAHPFDEDYITALEYGLPPTGGLGLGIDRIVMLFTDNYSIRDVLLYPTMKPRK